MPRDFTLTQSYQNQILNGSKTCYNGGMSFYFKQPIMPTAFNIQKILEQRGYPREKSEQSAKFSDCNLLLDEKCTEQLEFKHLLAQLTAQHCPDVMPLTYYIDQSNFDKVCQQAPPNQQWILKPSLLNNGEGLRLCPTLSDVSDYFLSNQRFDGPHVLQQYINPPHLLQGHKYSIRLFVVITNYCGAYLYPEGYFNVAKQAYSENEFADIACHLTNEHLTHADEPDSIQIPTSKAPHFQSIFKALEAIITKLISGLKLEAPQLFTPNSDKGFSIFGFDFMLDKQLRAWLLEVNHGPCFPTTDQHILHQHLYNDFWQAIVDNFVQLIIDNHPTTKKKTSFFEVLA
ncbi:MAG: hypothetical protein P1U63_12140 [Coxiellaceae bacterium]|nr:hypothetical protein [Coxiellaceae bacterium]